MYVGGAEKKRFWFELVACLGSVYLSGGATTDLSLAVLRNEAHMRVLFGFFSAFWFFVSTFFTRTDLSSGGHYDEWGTCR